MESMSSFFDLPIARIRKIIDDRSIPSIYTYYFLGRRVNEQCTKTSKNILTAIKDDDYRLLANKLISKQELVEYQVHDGPFHLNFCFESHSEVCEFVRKLKKATMISPTLIEVKGVLVKIKKLKGTNILYADFPPYYQGD